MKEINIDVDRSRKQYVLRTALFMGGYTIVNVAAIFGAFDDARGIGAWALGLVVSAPVVGHIWALLVYMRDADEYVRGMMAKRFIVATGITMALISTWGFLELYAHARHFPVAMALPLLWFCFGVVSPFMRNSRV